MKEYGALSSFFILMFFLNFAAMLILGGAVLNASIQRYRTGKLEQNVITQNNVKDKIVEKAQKVRSQRNVRKE